MTSADSTHVIVLPGGGYAAHAPHEAEPVAEWLGDIGVRATVFRYPPEVRHPVPLDALRAEISRRRAAGARRIAEDRYVPPEHTYRFASALAASHVPHAVHVFPHGPHSLGLARGSGGAEIWTTLAHAWIHEQAERPRRFS